MMALTAPLEHVPFISIDVETTGLDPATDEIVEIGAVKILNLRIVEEFDTLVWIDRTMPHEARRVHGIRNDMLVGKPRIGEAMAMLMEFIGDGALVEHSHKAFDVAFLERANGAAFGMPYINTCTLSRRLFPHIPKHGLDACCKRFAIVNDQPHRARSDARATAQLLIKMLELCRYRYPLLRDLVTVASVERST